VSILEPSYSKNTQDNQHVRAGESTRSTRTRGVSTRTRGVSTRTRGVSTRTCTRTRTRGVGTRTRTRGVGTRTRTRGVGTRTRTRVGTGTR
jgi:hypothetical protein